MKESRPASSYYPPSIMAIILVRDLREDEQEVLGTAEIIGVPEDVLQCTAIRREYERVCDEDAFSIAAEEELDGIIHTIIGNPDIFGPHPELAQEFARICSRMEAAVNSRKSSDCLDGTLIEQDVKDLSNRIFDIFSEAGVETLTAIMALIAGLLVRTVFEFMWKFRWFQYLSFLIPPPLFWGFVIGLIAIFLTKVTLAVIEFINEGMNYVQITAALQQKPEFEEMLGDATCAALKKGADKRDQEFLSMSPPPCTAFWDEVLIGSLEEGLEEVRGEGYSCPNAAAAIERLRSVYDHYCIEDASGHGEEESEDEEENSDSETISCTSLEESVSEIHQEYIDGVITCSGAAYEISILNSEIVTYGWETGEYCEDADSLLEQFKDGVREECDIDV